MVDWECGGHADHRAGGADTDVSSSVRPMPVVVAHESMKLEVGSLRNGN